MKLYRSSKHLTRWIAYSRETGWVMFPAERDGWGKRQPACGIDPVDIREIPVRLGFNTGLPGAPYAFGAAVPILLEAA
jgi:hypothetical protein